MAPSDGVSLSVHEAFSGIFGSISLAAWIFLLVPQLYENYTQGKADGISLAFLLIWFVGDVTNLLGAVWAGLVPTVIALAVYFCFADTVLILQCLYYKWVNRASNSTSAASTTTTATTAVSTEGGLAHGQPAVPSPTANGRAHSDSFDENTPLLSRQTSQPPQPNQNTHRRTGSNSSLGLPGSHMGQHHRRRSSIGTLAKLDEAGHPTASTAGGDDASGNGSIVRSIVNNVLSIIAICAIGTIGWALAWRIGAWKPAPPPPSSSTITTSNTSFVHPQAVQPRTTTTTTPLGASILGYISAILYLTARLPQIYKNARTRSCAGLSLLFFLLSLLGNITYGVGILAHSLEAGYVKTNTPWLLGSLGTVVEDCIVAAQFRLYGEGSSSAEEAKQEEAVARGREGAVA